MSNSPISTLRVSDIFQINDRVKAKFNMKAGVFTVLMALNYCSLLHAVSDKVSEMKMTFTSMCLLCLNPSLRLLHSH